MAVHSGTREREATATRLLASSARNSFDPDIAVDWDAEFVPGLPFMPLERISLYGTSLWDRLSPEQRIELSKHEIASALSVGLWFEILLMQRLARYAYELDPRTAHAQYALTEVGDETRHTVMFAKVARHLGVPRYGVHPAIHKLARVWPVVSSGPAMFASVLVAEETTDRFQRSMMNDDNIQPMIRTVARIHVIEEARHVRFAREEVVRRMRKLGPSARAAQRMQAAVVSYFVMDGLIDPRVYSSVGIDPGEGHRAARNNPQFRETKLWMGERIMPFLDEAGLIGGPSMRLWRKANLVR